MGNRCRGCSPPSFLSFCSPPPPPRYSSRARGRRYLPSLGSADVPRPAILIQTVRRQWRCPVPACLALACLVSGLVRFVALKRHRSVSDWHYMGRLHQKQNARNGCFLSLSLSISLFARWAVDLPFLRDPGCSTLSVLEHSLLIKPRRGGRLLATRCPPTPSINQSIIANRSRHLSDVSSSSEHAGPSRPRLGSSRLPPPTCQRVAAAPRPALSNEACRPSERVTSTWDSWLFAA